MDVVALILSVKKPQRATADRVTTIHGIPVRPWKKIMDVIAMGANAVLAAIVLTHAWE